MIISNAGSNQALFNLDHTAKSNQARSRHEVDTKKINDTNQLNFGEKEIAGNIDGLVRLQAVKDNQNSVAKEIRFADKSMQKIDSHIGQMKDELNTIVKNYPPFPPGSEERVKRLKSYSAMRGLIDKLTIPPEKTSSQMVSQKPNASESGVNGNSAGGQIGNISLPPQIKTPEVSEHASNEEINGAIQDLDRLQKRLYNSRSRLEFDVEAVVAGNDESKAATLSHEIRQDLDAESESIAPDSELRIASLLK